MLQSHEDAKEHKVCCGCFIQKTGQIYAKSHLIIRTSEWDSLMTAHENMLEFYKRELTCLRRMGAEFSRQYPKIAGRLELEADRCPDPHIERLIESFAFLSGRIQYNLESEFPRLSTALLGILYPQFVSPTPSMAIARFAVDPDQGGFTTGHLIPGHTPLFAQSEQGDICRFRTCYPLMLWPVQLRYAGFESPGRYDFLDHVPNAAIVLRLCLESFSVPLEKISMDCIRFHLNGDRMTATSLYELIFVHALKTAVLTGDRGKPLYPFGEVIRAVGFGPEENVLPDPPNAHEGYRLLHEYFAFPQKYLFFDLDLSSVQLSGSRADILLVLDQMPAKTLMIDEDTFCLGCTPVINLFHKTTEPIRIDGTRPEYLLTADSRRERITEIHSIRSVHAVRGTPYEAETVEPYFSFTHGMEGNPGRPRWYARREKTGRSDLPGTRIYLCFTDMDFHPARPPGTAVFAKTLCTNRWLAEQLPAGTLLQIEEAAPVLRISVLQKPMAQIDPPLDGSTLWRLISHLSLNYLSLSEGEKNSDALREILMIYSAYDLMDTWRRSDIAHQVAGIRDLVCRKVVRRMGSDAWRGFCRGTEISLTVDESQYTASSPFLLASVLDHFFALYTSVNTFTQLILKSHQREGIWKIWPPRAGEQIIF